MAAVLALTSLPLTAVALAAETSAMSKSDTVSIETKTADDWSGSVTALAESYATFKTRTVHLWNLSVWASHILENISLVKDGQYRIAVNARKNADSTENAIVLGLRDGSDTTRNAGKDWITGEVAAPNYFKAEYFLSGVPLSGKVTLTDSFADYYIPFTAPTTSSKAELHLYGYKSATSTIADISRFAIEKYDSATGTWTAVNEWVASAAYDAKWGTHPFSDKGVYSYVYKEWMVASVDSASATYDIEDVKLLPGVYHLTGTFFTDADTASVSVKANDTAMTVGVTEATSEEISDEEVVRSFTLTVSEETELSSLTLTWSKDPSSAASEIRFKDIELCCVDLVDAAGANANILRGVTVMRADSVAFWSADDENASIVVDDSKNYVHCRLQGAGAGFKRITLYSAADPEGSLLKLDTLYKITIKLRQNEANVNTDKAIETVLYVDGTKYKSFYNTIPAGDGWTVLEHTFSLPTTVNSQVTLGIFPNCTAQEWVDWDFRGIAVYEAENPKNVPLAYGEYNKAISPLLWTFPIRDGNNMKSYCNLTEFLLVPAVGGTSFTYNAAAKGIWLDPGTYVVSGTFGATEGDQTIQLIVAAEDGTTAIGETVTVGSSKSPVEVELVLERRTKLSSVTVSVGDGEAVCIGNIMIAVKKEKFTAPNVGIMMALLLKKRGFVYTNIIADATTEEGLGAWSVPEGATLTIGDDGKPYLAMANITKSSDAFVYAPGITLEPGTYKLTGKMRTSVKGETTQNRIWFDGTRVGTLKLDNSWLKFEFTITVNEATELELKFNGDAADVFNKSYDIRELALIDLGEEQKVKDSEAKAEAENTTETE